MTPERWLKIQELFAEALEREPAERANYLTEVCTDPSLRQEVELMIDAHEQGDSGFLEPPFAESKETLKSGSRIGQYEVLAAIGTGGMGEVYRARDTKLGRDVALKILPATFARDPERLARFQREAKFLASLNHPNIASIYGLEDAGDTRALVLELVEGPTLADRIKAGPIPIDEALHIAKHIADAVEYAHERGVVHRDLKPANIKISRDDVVKILDFGLAKAVHGEAEATNAGDSPTLSEMATRAGVLLGTAAYMSPEQAKGKPVDRRADVWAFGCVLCEMLTGKRTFPADTTPETLAAVLHNEPDWSQLPSATPIHVRVLMHRCLQKDPKQRLRDIGDARISLDEVLSGAAEDTIGPTAPAPFWRRALPWTLAVLSFVAVAVLVFVYFRQRAPSATRVLRYEIFPPEKSSFVQPYLALSPDGKHLAFTAETQGGDIKLWIRDLDSLVSRPLSGTEGASGPFWSPDGREIAFQVGHKLERVDLSGGATQVICDVDFLLGGAWNSAGTIVFGTFRGLMAVPATGGTPSRLTAVDVSRGETAHGSPSFLPAGRRFLYARGWAVTSARTFLGSLNLGDLQPEAKPLADGLGFYTPGSGSDPGHIVFMQSNGALEAQAFDISRAQVEGDPIRIADDVNYFTASADVLAYFKRSTTPIQLTWFDRNGKSLGIVGEPGMVQPWVALSPDDRTVAVARVDPATGESDVFLYDLQGGNGSRFTFGGNNSNPVWSPDGSRIAYTSMRENIPSVYQKAVNGVGQGEAFEGASGNPRAPLDWSRDGRYLIESSYPSSLRMLPLLGTTASDGRKSVPYSDEGVNAGEATLSPSGQWIAYVSDKTGRNEIYVETFPRRGGLWQVSVNGGEVPEWSRDGRELYFIGADGKLMAVEVKRGSGGIFQGTAPRVLFDPHFFKIGWFFNKFAVSKDGRFLIPVMPAQPGASPINIVVNWEAMLKK
jgi:serine/threonine protein kinase/Tol biopolymer transport system component